MTIAWWHWLVAGFCLIGLELLIPSFTIIWFGLGALAVAVMLLVVPGLPIWLQLLFWAAASVACSALWFKYLKPRENHTRSGQSKEAIVGETGMIIRGAADSYAKGRVRFRISILGADEWTCYADEPLAEGDSVRVVDIEGQLLKVQKN